MEIIQQLEVWLQLQNRYAMGQLMSFTKGWFFTVVIQLTVQNPKSSRCCPFIFQDCYLAIARLFHVTMDFLTSKFFLIMHSAPLYGSSPKIIPPNKANKKEEERLKEFQEMEARNHFRFQQLHQQTLVTWSPFLVKNSRWRKMNTILPD